MYDVRPPTHRTRVCVDRVTPFFDPIVRSTQHNATQPNTAGNQFYGLAIGGALMISSMSLGPITGSALNFAVWFGAIVSAWIDDDRIQCEYAWVYIIGPAFGLEPPATHRPPFFSFLRKRAPTHTHIFLRTLQRRCPLRFNF